MKSRPALLLIATTAAVALLATACSGSTEPTGGETDPAKVSGTVTFWTYPLGVTKDVSWWQPYIADFQQEYPNVKVDVVMQSFSNREEALVTAIAGNNAPDVVYFNPDFIPKFAEEDLLVPLDDLRDDWGDFYDSALAANTWENKLYAAPLLMQLRTSYCNTGAMAAAGVATCPTTWAELRDAAPKFVKAGFYATEYNAVGTLNQSFYVYLWQAGGEVLSEDMKSAAFNGPEGLEALKFIKEMVDNDWVPEQPLTVTEPFEQSAVGQAKVGYVPGSSLTSTRKVVDPKIIQTVQPMRHKEQVASGSVGAWSVFNTPDADAARAWVRYLSGEKFIREFNEATGYLPTRKSIDDLFADDPQIAEGMRYLDNVRVGVIHPKAREIIDTIRPHIQSVLLKGTDPQAALDAAAQEVNDLLARG